MGACVGRGRDLRGKASPVSQKRRKSRGRQQHGKRAEAGKHVDVQPRTTPPPPQASARLGTLIIFSWFDKRCRILTSSRRALALERAPPGGHTVAGDGGAQPNPTQHTPICLAIQRKLLLVNDFESEFLAYAHIGGPVKTIFRDVIKGSARRQARVVWCGGVDGRGVT